MAALLVVTVKYHHPGPTGITTTAYIHGLNSRMDAERFFPVVGASDSIGTITQVNELSEADAYSYRQHG